MSLKIVIELANIRLVDKKLESLEQYTRRNNLGLFGVEEKSYENTNVLAMDIIRNKLNVNINLSDIERSHRVGNNRVGNHKPRAIIIKFGSYRVREQIFFM